MKNVFITGGSGGIGSAIAKLLSENGLGVAIGYNSAEKTAEYLAAEINRAGGRAVAVRCNVADAFSVESAVCHTVEHLGELDALVNCAGISYIGLMSEMSLAEWENIVRVNLTGAFLCTKAVLPNMIREHRGSIVNIASMWGEVGASCEVAYSATKAGLIGFTKALASELAPSGIRVNCVSPGLIDTPMNKLSGAELAMLYEEIPMGRSGTAREIAEAVEFLISEKSAYITGQVISVNGGMVM